MVFTKKKKTKSVREIRSHSHVVVVFFAAWTYFTYRETRILLIFKQISAFSDYTSTFKWLWKSTDLAKCSAKNYKKDRKGKTPHSIYAIVCTCATGWNDKNRTHTDLLRRLGTAQNSADTLQWSLNRHVF